MREEARCILVGLQLKGNGRDLLDWALGTLAQQGDRVVVVHVCRDSDLQNTSTLSLIDELDNCLTVYQTLCTQKQIVLVGRVSRGNSIKKTMVKEANQCAATAVVVGVKKDHIFRCPLSLVRYCSKKLSLTTDLFAIDNGKAIYKRGARRLLSGTREPNPNFRSILHPTVGVEPHVVIPNPEPKLDSLHATIEDVGGKEDLIDQSVKLLDQEAEGPSNSHAYNIRTSPEPVPGWPLLRQAHPSITSIAKDADADARKMSVVQWAMNLPNRSPPPDQHQFHKAYAFVTTDIAKELDVIFRNNRSTCKRFQIQDLQTLIDQFSPDSLIGKGGSSRVYKGCLPDGQESAIKLSKLSAKALRDFILEADIVTSLWHERITPLLGVAMEEKNLISIYKYFSNGSLEENLHGKKNKPSLTWDVRFKIAVGVAEALNYLHKGCGRSVIHRDVKSSNILLSDEFDPQLSDFGLAIWAPADSSYLIHNDVVGTFGYLAPEYFMYGKVSDKIDVYAFGVILLELLTGRKPISDQNPNGEESLVMWATPILERGNVTDLLDSNLDSGYDMDQLQRVVLAASFCLKRAARLRPQINQILSLLRGENVHSWMNSNTDHNPKESDCFDDEMYPQESSFGSHLDVALLDVDDDDNASISVFEQSQRNTWEEYLKNRWSRSSSFD